MRRVRDPEELAGALETLHGRWFSSEDVLYDPETRSMSISLARRDDGEGPLLVRNLGWFYRRWRVQLRETLLVVHGVRDHRIAEGDWRLEALGFHGGEVAIYALEVPVVRAAVDALDLEFGDTPNVVGERVESCALGFLRRYEIRR